MKSDRHVRTHSGIDLRAARVRSQGELPRALKGLGLVGARPVLVVIGGAGGLAGGELERLRPLFEDAVAPAASACHATVVDGGTDAGVIGLIGEARARLGADFPLVGVAVDRLVAGAGGRADEGSVAVEPHHTHLVLVPGKRWGDESSWLAAVADALSRHAPSVTLLVEGGEIAWRDAVESVRRGRRVIALAGSGRTADRLAASLATPADRLPGRLAGSGLVDVIDWDDRPGLLRAVTAALS